MPLRNRVSGSPEDWLYIARSDLALAKIEKKSYIRYAELCFPTQQAVEKCIKAVLVKKGIEFPKTHIIQVLLELLPGDLADSIFFSSKLTFYANTYRYPGDYEDIDEKAWEEAVNIAEKVLEWAEEIIGK